MLHPHISCWNLIYHRISVLFFFRITLYLIVNKNHCVPVAQNMFDGKKQLLSWPNFLLFQTNILFDGWNMVKTRGFRQNLSLKPIINPSKTHQKPIRQGLGRCWVVRIRSPTAKTSNSTAGVAWKRRTERAREMRRNGVLPIKGDLA